MTLQHMRLEIDGDGIATVTFDREGGCRNLVDEQWLADFERVLDELASSKGLGGVILASAGDGFPVALDPSVLSTGSDPITPSRGFAVSQRISALFRRLETLGVSVVAAIGGAARGVGLELALACHGRIAADEPDVLLALPDVAQGRVPCAGGTQRLPRLIGVVKASGLLLHGDSISAAEADALGIIDALVPAETLLAAARQWFAGSPRTARPWDEKGFAPPESRGLLLPEVAATYAMATAGVAGRWGYDHAAPVAVLSCVFEGMQLPFDRALAIESKYFGRVLAGIRERSAPAVPHV